MEFEKKRRQMLNESGGAEHAGNQQQRFMENQAAIHQAAQKVIRDLMLKHSKQQAKDRNSLSNDTSGWSSLSSGGEKLFIVVLIQNLKRMGEAALRWSFFILNMFILTLTIC